VEFVLSRAARAAYAHVFPVGSITAGLKGYGSLSDIRSLKEAGVVALSDDGVPVVAADVMAEAMLYARDLDLLLVAHAEDYGLSGGAVTEGPTSSTTGLGGTPPEAEEILIARDLILLRYTGGKLHVAHVSGAASLAHIRRAKAEGLDVTCETAPHYLLLTDAAAASFDPNAKMNPPLRSAADREAVVAALADGTIDAIASDHAPHTAAEKDAPFAASSAWRRR
jgi:dihydroorotase